MAANSNKSDPFEENEEFLNSLTSIERFYSKIKSVPQLIDKAFAIDQLLSSQFQEIKTTAEIIVSGLNQKKEELLNSYDGLLFPAAKEVLEELSRDTLELKIDLEDTLNSLQDAAKKDWIEHATRWVQIYAKWQDSRTLTQKVIKVAADKNQALIDRDIKVIHDYKNQSLSHLSEESEEFKNLEMRLKQATDQPLKELVELKTRPLESSPKQLVDWIANLHNKREDYFDHVLMKIDAIVKDTVKTGEQFNMESYSELEGEIAFLEAELHEINQTIPHLNWSDEKEINLVEISVEGLKEHLDGLDLVRIPPGVKVKVDKLYNMIAATLFRLKER